jgi:mRNA interferase RelE/StbE
MYNFEFHPEAKKELKKLNNSIQILFTKKLKQILNSPEIGIKLGNKNNLKLAGFKKVYFNNKKHRIVYETIENKVLIYIIAVGKREEMNVYKKASSRVDYKK